MQRLDKAWAQTAALKVPELPSSGNFAQGHPKPAFSEKGQRGNQEKFFKNRPKSSPRLNGPKAHWRKWHYPLSSTHLKCKDGRKFSFKQRLQKFPNGQVMGTFARSFKTRIFWKKGMGDQGKFFKNLPKSWPPLTGLKAHLRKWHYDLISVQLKGKDWRRFWRKKAAPKVPEWPSYGNFGKVIKKPHFLKKCKGGTKGNFSKIPQKDALAEKAHKHSGANGIIL